jgi:hypothetical protein
VRPSWERAILTTTPPPNCHHACLLQPLRRLGRHRGILIENTWNLPLPIQPCIEPWRIPHGITLQDECGEKPHSLTLATPSPSPNTPPLHYAPIFHAISETRTHGPPISRRPRVSDRPNLITFAPIGTGPAPPAPSRPQSERVHTFSRTICAIPSAEQHALGAVLEVGSRGDRAPAIADGSSSRSFRSEMERELLRRRIRSSQPRCPKRYALGPRGNNASGHHDSRDPVSSCVWLNIAVWPRFSPSPSNQTTFNFHPLQLHEAHHTPCHHLPARPFARSYDPARWADPGPRGPPGFATQCSIGALRLGLVELRMR